MTVSILLPMFNRRHTLARCIASLQAQTITDWSLIAVDDGSTDGSAEWLEGLGDGRITVLRHERNRGASAARNTAMRSATGEYIALIDSDDEWLPAKLERQLALLEGGTAEGCGCEYWLVSGNTEIQVALPEPASWHVELQTRCALGNGTTLLARREALLAIGPLDEELRLYEDWDWMLRFTRRFRYAVVPEPLARVHSSGPRDPALFAQSAERFLRLHEEEFRTGPLGNWPRTQSFHYEYVAANALAQRQFTLGARYLCKSVAADPLRRPGLLAALPVVAIDAAFGTSLLHRIAGW